METAFFAGRRCLHPQFKNGGAEPPRGTWIELREWTRWPRRGRRNAPVAAWRRDSTAQIRFVYEPPLRLPRLRTRAPGGEHLDEPGERGEPRIGVRPEGNRRPRAAAAMTISPLQYGVPLLPPRIGVARGE